MRRREKVKVVDTGDEERERKRRGELEASVFVGSNSTVKSGYWNFDLDFAPKK